MDQIKAWKWVRTENGYATLCFDSEQYSISSDAEYLITDYVFLLAIVSHNLCPKEFACQQQQQQQQQIAFLCDEIKWNWTRFKFVGLITHLLFHWEVSFVDFGSHSIGRVMDTIELEWYSLPLRSPVYLDRISLFRKCALLRARSFTVLQYGAVCIFVYNLSLSLDMVLP